MERRKRIFLAMVAVAALSATAPAFAGETFSFSFDPGTVRFGYADGYWDFDHHWHGWPSAREAEEFRHRYQSRIYGYRHTRYPNDGWHDGPVDNAQR